MKTTELEECSRLLQKQLEDLHAAVYGRDKVLSTTEQILQVHFTTVTVLWRVIEHLKSMEGS
jgi:hypothetical protein